VVDIQEGSLCALEENIAAAIHLLPNDFSDVIHERLELRGQIVEGRQDVFLLDGIAPVMLEQGVELRHAC